MILRISNETFLRITLYGLRVRKERIEKNQSEKKRKRKKRGKRLEKQNDWD